MFQTSYMEWTISVNVILQSFGFESLSDCCVREVWVTQNILFCPSSHLSVNFRLWTVFFGHSKGRRYWSASLRCIALSWLPFLVPDQMNPWIRLPALSCSFILGKLFNVTQVPKLLNGFTQHLAGTARKLKSKLNTLLAPNDFRFRRILI